jgi:hypothetical protein
MAAPSSVRASCGDRIRIQGIQENHAAAHDSIHLDQLPRPHTRVPCTGFDCSCGQETPPLNPPAPPPTDMENWICIEYHALPVAYMPGTGYFKNLTIDPIKRDSDVYHPPR